MAADLYTPQIERTVQAVARRALALPALLFLTGHRPLAFVVGQLLYVLDPCASLLGWRGGAEWAALLSDPAGPELLAASLKQAEDPSTT
ncbi:MAG: hypothetical protein HC802_00255 [Caldilineaceae bacterium]|nr:hypothetical protein [Caldilineaceae bacterium]